MSQATASLDLGAPIDLGRTPDFGLGTAQVHPSISEVSVAEHRIWLQPRVMQVLVALARADGEVVSRDDLVASCWGGLAVGDDAINRCIGRLRRLAETEARGAFTIETLPRIGYRLRRSAEATSTVEPPSGSTLRRWLTPWRIGGAAVLAAMAAGAVWFGVGMLAQTPQGQGVAVAAFDAPPGDAWSRMFADGLADEIASTLTKSDLVSLPAGSSAAGTELERDALSRRLGAAYTLSGRVQRAGAQLAVTVSLDDAQGHERLWSADFGRDASQAQDLESEVAAEVANVLHCAVAALGDRRQSRLDVETARLYLNACEDGDDGSLRVRDLYREVVTRQPRFADAWARLVYASALASQSVSPGGGVTAAASDARAAAKKALEIDPKAGLAYAALEALAPEDDLVQRQSLIQKGLAVSPDVAVLNDHESWILGEAGRFRDALDFSERAVELDPLNPDVATALAQKLGTHGFHVAALSMLERYARIWPERDEIKGARLYLEAVYGDPSAALQLLSKPSVAPQMPDAVLADWRAFILARQSGDKARIAAYVAQVKADLASRSLGAGRALNRLIGVQAVDAAFDVAAHATPDDPVDAEPFFRSNAAALRADPRFLPLMARLGVVAFWRSTGKWADFCDDPSRPYDCRVAVAKLGP